MASRKTVIKKIVVGRPIKSVDATSVGNASQLASNPPSYYLDYTNFTNTPNILDSADVALIAAGSLDSAEALNLIDSAYIQARATNIQNLRDSGSNIVISGNLLPDADSSRDIGSPTKKFKDLYLSGSTLFIGNTAISTDSATNEIKILRVDASGAVIETKGKISLVDSAQPSLIIDSDFIQARQIKYDFLDSAEVIQLVDSNYVAARTFTQADIEAIARGVSLDSVGTTALIDSAYVLARGIQNIKDSGAGISVRGDLIPDIDSAYDIGSTSRRFKELYLSGSTIFLGQNTITVDSASDFRILNGGGVLANLVADHLHLGTDKKKISVDSSGQLKFSTDDQSTNFGFNLAANNITDLADVNSGATAGQFLRWNGAQFAPFSIDSAYVAARTWSQADIEQFARDVSLDSAEAKVLIDSAINNVIDGAPGALDTLNELAAALNDDSNAFNTLNNLIATKLTASTFDSRFDSALATKTTDDVAEGSTNLYYTNTRVDTRVATFIDSAYVNAKLNTALFLDSSETIQLIDSAYVNARLDTSSFLDSSEAVQLFDSSYVQARQALVDSASIIAIIDSNYVASRQSSGNLVLGTVTDGSLTDGAIQTLTPATKIVDAIDELNEAMLNVSNNTFVRSVTFAGSPLAGGEGVTVTLNITQTGNANRFDVNWGDGTIDSAQTTTTPSHTYSTNTGSPFTVNVRAFNNAGSGVGSEALFSRSGYIIVYTADPVANYAAYAAPTGGSPITFWQDEDTVYFQNNTTNTTMANVTYRWTWGDGTQDIVDSDNAAGGVTGPRIGHTFTASTNTDVQRTTQLELTAHTTADPTVISGGVNVSDTFEIYDSYNVSYIVDALRKVNNSSTFTFTVENTGVTGFGSFATFGNTIRHNFIGGAQTINAGTGASGDIGQSINKTYSLTSSQQTSGTTASFDNSADLISNHANSPFSSNTLTVAVEPQLISNISLSADTVSDGSNDDSSTVYNFTDLLGRNRRSISATLNIENGSNTNSINFANAKTYTNVADNATQSFSPSGWLMGTNTVTVTSTSTPDTISQFDSASATFTRKAVPTAPLKIYQKTIRVATAGSGTLPMIAHNYLNNGGVTNQAGQPLDNSSGNGSHTRITTQNWQTNEVEDIDHQNGGFIGAFRDASGTHSSVGFVTTDGTLSQVGLYQNLRITQQRDMHASDATIPSEFYKVYSFRIEGVPNDLNYGFNRFLAKNNFGVPDGLQEIGNRCAFFKDFGNVVSIEYTGGVGQVSSSGQKFIGGVPYINSGSSSGLNVVGIRVRNLTTQCYTNQSNILEVDFDTNSEGTSNTMIPNTDFSYSDIVNASQMQGSNPHAGIGQSSDYTLETVIVPINSNIRSVGNLKMRARSVNGITSYSSHPATVRVYNASSIVGINETDITSSVPNKNGNGVRVSGFAAATGDTPSYTGSTNFYTSNAISHASDPSFQGTKEAGVSVNGLIQHDVTNYSGQVPSGPNRSGDTGNQYFTFAFRSTALQNFNIDLTSATGITGLFIALPGTGVDTSSSLNGWLDCSATYNGSGQPGAGSGGNGSNGCAFSGETVPTGSAISNQSYSMTFGTLSAAGSTGNVILVRLVLASGQSVSNIGVSQFA